MGRFLVGVGISVGSAAVGLLVAMLALPGFHVMVGGFLIAVVVFAIVQAVLSPLVTRLARDHAPQVLGGVGLVSTFLGLLIASLFPAGIRLTDLVTWVLATVIVWVITAVAAWLLPKLLLTDRRPSAR